MKHHQTKKNIHHIGIKCVEAWFFVVALLIMFFIGQGVARIEFEPVIPGATLSTTEKSTTLVSNIESIFTHSLVTPVTVEVMQSSIAAYPVEGSNLEKNLVNAEFTILVRNAGTEDAIFNHKAFTVFKVLDDEGNVIAPSNPQSVISCADAAYDHGYVVKGQGEMYCMLSYSFNNDAISSGFYKVEIATQDSTGFVAVSGRSSALPEYVAYDASNYGSVESYNDYSYAAAPAVAVVEEAEAETLWSPYGLTANILPGVKSIVDSVGLVFGH